MKRLTPTVNIFVVTRLENLLAIVDDELQPDENQEVDQTIHEDGLRSGSEFDPGASGESEAESDDREMDLENDVPDTELRQTQQSRKKGSKKEKKGVTARGEVRAIRDKISETPNTQQRKLSSAAEYISILIFASGLLPFNIGLETKTQQAKHSRRSWSELG